VSLGIPPAHFGLHYSTLIAGCNCLGLPTRCFVCIRAEAWQKIKEPHALTQHGISPHAVLHTLADILHESERTPISPACTCVYVCVCVCVCVCGRACACHRLCTPAALPPPPPPPRTRTQHALQLCQLCRLFPFSCLCLPSRTCVWMTVQAAHDAPSATPELISTNGRIVPSLPLRALA
jgi:hypothetical protein